ncbi:uncharacterized protein ACA1_092960 [Acanthamoeba castellanii str. Neff]|uniref:Uncharacterized protein n=1 Tax=Acanthamoeba castellanii (strain ATCC 30010 / Neff) TaxID=1257118 RepID=L8GKN5_ACACF|nr:uncharacterized protein ACA1_092960 [Acanthamoeba castellanii str. Neff]ELR12761.1 hypothetical protein ACA1_092960 [Acanthamoeba castellanii str. Neff]
MSREGTVPVAGGGHGTSTFALYPVFASPEEEYKYISSRMAELERHLGMAADLTTSCVTLPPPSSTTITPKLKKEKTKKKKDGKKEKRKKEGSKIKQKTKKDKTTKAKKKKKKSIKGLNKEKEAAASDLDTSQEQDSTVSVGKAKELERDSVFGGADVPDQLQAIDQELRDSTDTSSESKPRLRKAASFLFNKTSEMRSYFRKMSADIRDLASTKEMDATAPTSTTTKDLKKAPSFKQQKKKSTKANKKRQRRSAQEGPYNASSSGDDLNNMQADSDSDDGSQLTYDARYTDAVFVFSSSSDSRQLHPVVGHNYGRMTISDHETFSIMIEEDTATYDSPTMLATAMPEVEIDVELDEASDDDGEIDHHRHTTASARTNAATPAAGPRHSVASWRQPAALPPVMLRVPTSPAATSLASKASYRMTMPPVLPPSTAQPPHQASRQSPQPQSQLLAAVDVVPQPPFRSGWGARRPLPPIPAHGGRTRSYAHSSGAVPTSARPRTGTCIC